MVGTLNPKLALFLLAFLPQFIDPSAGPVWVQTLVLGTLFSLIATVGDSLFALGAGSVAERWRSGDRSGLLAQRLSGGLLIGLGAFAALSEGPGRRTRTRASPFARTIPRRTCPCACSGAGPGPPRSRMMPSGSGSRPGSTS